MNGQIHIFVNKTENGEIQPQDGNQIALEDKDVEKEGIQKSAVASALINAGQQAISQSVNWYGEITGDMTTVKKINNMVGLAGDVLMIAKGGVIGAISVATKYAFNAVNSAIAIKNENRQLDYNNSMLGDISTKGSRYW